MSAYNEATILKCILEGSTKTLVFFDEESLYYKVTVEIDGYTIVFQFGQYDLDYITVHPKEVC